MSHARQGLTHFHVTYEKQQEPLMAVMWLEGKIARLLTQGLSFDAELSCFLGSLLNLRVRCSRMQHYTTRLLPMCYIALMHSTTMALCVTGKPPPWAE